ncbi:MAG: hypothetical protein IJR14_02285, partial [Synergistaceae bacterium]|nr:hypothetical protein [Synergistaceae bacterium]
GLIYFGQTPKDAKRGARSKARVMPVYLNVKDPVNTKETPVPWYEAEDSFKVDQWRQEGHDGVYVQDEAGVSLAVFSPAQIKSATDNRGTFDASDPDIYHQTGGEGEETAPAAGAETTDDPGAGWDKQDAGLRSGAVRGRVEFQRESGKAIIKLMQSADPSTFLHEMFHVALDDLMLFGRREDAKEEVRRDWETVMDWLGVSDLDFSLFGLTKAQRAKLTDEQRARHERDMARWRVAQEKFADTGEAYLQTGKAPSKGLRGAFERIRAWLLKVYDGVKDDIEISDEVRDVFDRILATREEIDAEHEAQVTVGDLATEEKLLRVRIFQLGGQARRLEERIREAQARGEDVSSLEREAARLWSRRKRIEAKRDAKKRLRNDIKRMGFQMEAAAKDGRVIYHRQIEIRELLKGYDVRPDDKKTRENRADVAAFLSAYPGHTKGLTEKELRYLGTTTLGEMTVAQVRELHEQVREIRRKGQLELELKELLRKEAIDAARKELLGPMLALHEARRKGKGPGAVRGRHDMGKEPEYEGLKGKVRRFADWTYANTLGAQRFFDHLDGGMGSFDGAWIKLFADRPNEARDEELRHILRRRSSIEKVMGDLGLTPAGLRQTRDVPGVHGKSGKAWTVDELMGIYAGMKNERSREAILYGVFKEQWAAGLDPEAAAAKCVAALTDEEKELADAIIKDYEVNFDRIDGALVDVFNKGMDKEENYTPMRRLEYTTAEGLMDPDSAEAMMNARARAGGMGKVDRGFQQTRVRMTKKDQRAIDLGLVSIWNSQVEVQEHAAAFSGLIRDMRQILLGRSEGQELTVQALVNEVHGRAAWQQIKTYYGILARNDTKIAHDVLESAAGTLAKNMATAYLCGNLATALKQFPSFFRFLPYCGPGHLLSAIGEMMEKREAFFEECYELDPQLRNRMGNAMIAAMRTAGTLRGGKYGMALDAGMKLIGMVDRLASTIGWKAVYDANIKAGKSPKDAVRAAQRAVLLTQPASQAKDMPRMWNQSGYAKLAMIFSMDAAQRFGITVYDLWVAVRAGKWPRFIWTLAGLTLGTMAVQALSDGGPDDWADISELSAYWARAFARDAVSTLPLVGKEALAAWDMHMGDGYF